MDTEPRSAASKQTIRFNRRIENVIIPLIESADALLYTLVGLVFLAGAAGMLGYSVWSFPGNVTNPETGGFPFAIITLINDLLLVMIIMEVLRTVLSYLAERGGSLRPFLFIASISATRRILAIGAQMSVSGDKLTPDRFQQSMIDLGVNAGAILALAVALFLLMKRPDVDP
ncbi:MAG: phosphate-starvation-inducible PsiE family protein [Chloroflexota bacterium]|nr:phosphate-starvation-inducible PsiE family protein [Chloroflexota bacterium]